MAVQPPICDFGRKAPEFKLPGIDGKAWSLADVKGPNGTLVMFICNHCPYVKAVADRIARDAKALRDIGIGIAAINANDPTTHPEDSFDNMKVFAESHGFAFPYLFDQSQDIARAYDAACTPDFFGYNKDLELQYRGRLDASLRNPAPPDARRELLEAMTQVARTGRGPAEQIPSMGCSIKWRRAG